MRTRWKESHITLLIKILRNHEFIWNSKHAKYTRNRKGRNKHWQSVLKIFYDSLKNKTYQPQDVQSKWHNLRSQFHLRHQKYSTEGFGKKRWRYYDMLTFLTGHGASKRQPAVALADRRKYFLRAKVGQSMMEETNEDSDMASMSPKNSTEDEKETNNNDTLSKVNESDDDSYVSIGSISPRYQDDEQGAFVSTSVTISYDRPQSPTGENERFEADLAGVCDMEAILHSGLE